MPKLKKLKCNILGDFQTLWHCVWKSMKNSYFWLKIEGFLFWFYKLSFDRVGIMFQCIFDAIFTFTCCSSQLSILRSFLGYEWWPLSWVSLPKKAPQRYESRREPQHIQVLPRDCQHYPSSFHFRNMDKNMYRVKWDSFPLLSFNINGKKLDDIGYWWFLHYWKKETCGKRNWANLVGFLELESIEKTLLGDTQ